VLGSALNAAIGDNGTRATVLSLFSGAIKIGMVFTGFALGSVLRKSSSLGNACALCGLLLFGAVVCYLTGLQGRQQHRKSVNGKKNQ
jgi:predicted MFS family arabinose efflux permease